ncbi:hypothetical protein [Roseibium sp. MMSF_3544]|uniref:hypothetical protein n=1 Tax=unclassified Roseibium TaxID=2629323 RepID=UPI00273DEEF4|nr:hypothetical protein [Roseibium sp. MMSF_3544]
MTMRKTTFLSFLAAGAAVFLFAATAHAGLKIVTEDADAVTEGQPDRFSLVEADGDILRVDKQNGTVSICRKQNSSWRCNPVPLAEEAYLAEINELASEVDRLKARLEQIEGDDPDASPQAPGSVLKRPESGSGNETSRWTEEDEEFERVLSFTESAMRRFFGMVRDLQKDFDGEGN